MMQLPLSALPGAAPTADPVGLGGGTTASTTEGDAASAFASLLTAMQTGAATDAVTADGLGLVPGDGEAPMPTDQGDGEAEIPAGLAALVQSLIVPGVATPPVEGDTTGEIAMEATPLSALIETVTAAETPTAETAVLTGSPEPVTAEAIVPAAAGGTVRAGTVAAVSGASIDAEPTLGIRSAPTAPSPTLTETPDLDLTTDPPTQPVPTATTVLDDVEVPEAESSAPGRPATPANDQVADELPAETLASARTVDAAATDAQAGTTDDDRPPTSEPATTQDDGETSTQTTSIAGAAPETGSARTAPAADHPRTGAERLGARAATTADATTNVAAPAVTQTPANVERADAPVTIERITLREMPTVVVDRIRAIDPQGGANRAVVRLDPPELGRIMLEVVSNGDEISVIARADNAEAVRALVRQRTEIEAALEALGLSMSDFDVKQDDGERQEAEPDARREGGYDDRRPAADTGYATTDTPTTEGELFL